MTLNLNGLIPATVLPMDADGSIDEPALRSYIGWVVDQGPVALAINVDTGEGPHLTHDEKVRVLKIVRDVTDTADRRRARRAVDRRRRPPGAGLPGRRRDALLVFPIPAYLSEPLDSRVPVAYHEAIADVGLPLILFQLQPALAGRELRAGHAPGDGVGRRRRRDQGGVVRRPPVRRHGPAARASCRGRSRS